MNGENKHTYAVKEPNEDALHTVITKSGISVDFTPADMILEQTRCEKIIKELEGKREVERMKMENIEAHHPFVKEMSLQDLFTAHMYYESKALVDAIPPKVEEMKKQLQESRDEQVHIAAVTGLDILPKTKEEAVDAAMEKLEGAPAAPEAPAKEDTPDLPPSTEPTPPAENA